MHTLFVSVSLVYTIHFTFFVHPHSSFMGCSRQYGDKENHKSALTLLFDVFLLTLNVSGIVGICMLFTKDERSRKIIAFATGSLSHLQLQPSRSPLESSGISELQSANFSATVNHSPLEVHPLHEGSGVNYPFRDPCNKKGDPVCERGTVFYYGATISNPESDFRLQIKTNTSEDPLFGESVSFNRSLHLRKRDIGCSGGNEFAIVLPVYHRKACITECEKHSGVWNCSSNLCIVQIYLTSICVRLAYHNETSRWTLDVPP